METDKSWREVLMDDYPTLFGVESGGHGYAPGFPATGEGWRDLLQRVLARIAAADMNRVVRINQIKEKHGTLRLYWSSTASIGAETYAAIEEAIALAEARSECTCETCGAEGRLHIDAGWYATACPEHARGRPIRVRAGQEGLRVVETIVGKRSSISCRRYVRETDSFVDVDPKTVDLDD